ncbi:major facilitator superfamily domain-containing protein [Rhodocollybia butyracea]|uniref:Major facilitator superfamily domain-containing protein n=1 Tax=Rhodocollybia butyracea TaxID=206335 RepID=A0A9P5TWN2_9AGAR|nr:major facilitator superfamily domain-containing protein [Rhodocollybia butyracea]
MLSRTVAVKKEVSTESFPVQDYKSLPPVDRGIEAWTCCISAFFIEFLFWGPQSSFGTFQSYYGANPPFNRSTGTDITLIGTAGLALEYAAGIVLMFAFQKRPQYFKLLMWLAGIVGASFTTKVWVLIICQGVLPGLAAALISFPVYIWMTQWFVERRGLASGIMIAGASLGGVCLPLILSSLLGRFGVPWTMRIWASITLVIGTLAIYFSNPRLPPVSDTPGAKLVFSLRSFMSIQFLSIALASCIQAAAYFPVTVFLPTQASKLGISNPNIVLSALNLASIPSRLAWGFASDRFSAITLLSISSASSGVLAFPLYGFGNGFGALLSFALLFGLLAGGYSSMWAQACCSITSKDSGQVTVLYSALFLARGTGCIVGPIVASVLYHPSTVREGINGSAYGLFGSGPLIILVGSLMIVSAPLSLLAHWGSSRGVKTSRQLE